MQLPLLIMEILDYYRYTIPQRERMKRLHEEYESKVWFYRYENISEYSLGWEGWGISLPIVILSDDRPDNIYEYYGVYRCVRSFLRYPSERDYLPPKYVYSSGLNHPTGYKFKRLFPTSKMVFFDYITHNKKPNKSTESYYYNNPD